MYVILSVCCVVGFLFRFTSTFSPRFVDNACTHKYTSLNWRTYVSHKVFRLLQQFFSLFFLSRSSPSKLNTNYTPSLCTLYVYVSRVRIFDGKNAYTKKYIKQRRIGRRVERSERREKKKSTTCNVSEKYVQIRSTFTSARSPNENRIKQQKIYTEQNHNQINFSRHCTAHCRENERGPSLSSSRYLTNTSPQPTIYIINNARVE